MLNKYQTANRTLDIHNIIEREIAESTMPEQTVADILSRSFMRSVAIFGTKTAVSAWNNENIAFWEDKNEKAVLEWVKSNHKPAGKGSDTLRSASALYLPFKAKNGVTVVAFSCQNSKFTVTDRLIFSQIEPLLQLVL